MVYHGQKHGLSWSFMVKSVVDHGQLWSTVWLIMVNLMVKCMVNHGQLRSKAWL